MPSPENCLSATIRLIPMNNHIGQVYKNNHFLKRDWHSDDFGLRNPAIQKRVKQKCATSIVERVNCCYSLGPLSRGVPDIRGSNRTTTTCGVIHRPYAGVGAGVASAHTGTGRMLSCVRAARLLALQLEHQFSSSPFTRRPLLQLLSRRPIVNRPKMSPKTVSTTSSPSIFPFQVLRQLRKKTRTISKR